MSKLITGIVSIACIMLFLALVSIEGAVKQETLFQPINAAETAVSVSEADKQIQAVQTVRTQAYEPQYTYVNRIPETSEACFMDAKPVEIPEDEIIAIARMMYGECGSEWIPIEEKAAVCWVVCNRVDSDDPYFPDTIVEVVTQKGQFCGYKESNPVTQELYDIALDVLTRWHGEKSGMGYVGRVIPRDFLFFTGNGIKNVFRDAYRQPYQEWDWSLPSPYEDCR